MGSLSSFNCGVKYLLCVIDVFTKHVWVKPLKSKTVKTVKKAKAVLHRFIEIVNKSKRKANKICVDQGKEFYDSFMQNC